ncbi:hypothetical protein PROFUN_02813 [Planoprotostelium fungivorum]|uniref:Uncharacterized protein n=1 Tax=Planoprotostelium fungivorum TaxID=1890364 RepID=A0A2P6NXN2_9EUKA|nr:hypothetical protein PROFUN_02813 [Planoprotostelium fungivorum]
MRTIQASILLILLSAASAQFTVSQPLLNGVGHTLTTNFIGPSGLLLTNPVSTLYAIKPSAVTGKSTSAVVTPRAAYSLLSPIQPLTGSVLPLGLIMNNAPDASFGLHSDPQEETSMQVDPSPAPQYTLPTGYSLVPTKASMVEGGKDKTYGVNIKSTNPDIKNPTMFYSPVLDTQGAETNGQVGMLKTVPNSPGAFTEVPSVYDNKQGRIIANLGNKPEGAYVFTVKHEA